MPAKKNSKLAKVQAKVDDKRISLSKQSSKSKPKT